jgi:phosphate-selective porin OprO/OprP
VPVISIPASFQQLLNLQVAAASGPLWSQAEWYGSWIDQTDGGTVFFHGSYVSCGYFLTGEHREYEAAGGTLGAVKVNRPYLHWPGDSDRRRGGGAWELTARFAYLDFFDTDTPPSPSGQLIGTEQPQSTLGVNWYLSDHVRLMFNYTYTVPTVEGTGTSSANIFASRLGVWW